MTEAYHQLPSICRFPLWPHLHNLSPPQTPCRQSPHPFLPGGLLSRLPSAQAPLPSLLSQLSIIPPAAARLSPPHPSSLLWLPPAPPDPTKAADHRFDVQHFEVQAAVELAPVSASTPIHPVPVPAPAVPAAPPRHPVP